MRELSSSDGATSLRGFVSSEGITNKRKQFVYLNGRFAGKSSLQKAVNEILKKKSVMCKPSPPAKTAWEGGGSGGVNQESPTKAAAMHAVYCLKVSCPTSEFVACQEPNGTNVDFRDWAAVRAFLEEALTGFLQENGLLNVSAAASLAMAETKVGAVSPRPAALSMNLSLNITGIRPLESQLPEESFGEDVELEEEDTLDEDVAKSIETAGSDEARPIVRPFGIEYEGSRQSVPVERTGGASTVRRKRSDPSEETVPDGWIKKPLPGGKAVFVHLKSGNTVQKLKSLVASSKRSRSDSHLTPNDARQTVIDRMLPGMCPMAAVGRPKRKRTTKVRRSPRQNKTQFSESFYLYLGRGIVNFTNVTFR